MALAYTNFLDLLRKKRGTDFVPPNRLLCLDPGETTGWSLFVDGLLVDQGQVYTKDGWSVILQLFQDTTPSHVVFENYRVYAHKLERHSNSEVYTLRLVGVIEFICDVLYKIPRVDQMAHQAKGFVTDDKLQAWGFYAKGKRHARDSVRHGIYFLLFDKSLD